MAVTDELLVKVTVESREANKELPGITKHLQLLVAASEEVVASLKRIEGAFATTALQAKDTQKSVTATASAFQQLGAAAGDALNVLDMTGRVLNTLTNPQLYKTTALVANGLGRIADTQGFPQLANHLATAAEHMAILAEKVAHATRQFRELTGAIEKDTLSLSDLRGAIVDVTHVFDNLVNAFAILTSPNTYKRLEAVVNLLGVLALSQGNMGIAKQLFQAADQIENVETKMLEMAETSENVFDTMGRKAENVNDTFTFMERTVKGVGAAMLAGGILRFASELSGSVPIIAKASMNMSQLGIDAMSTAKIIRSSFLPGILGVVEQGALIGPVLFGVGRAAMESESAMVRFAGTVSLVAGLLFSSFSLAAIGLARVLGDLAIMIGDKLIDAMTVFEEKFVKFTAIMAQFKFAVTGFNETLGSDAVGSLKMWEEQMAAVEKSTTFSTEAIAKSIKLLVAEGSRLGLTVDQNKMLLQRAADVASNTGSDLTETTQALLSALTGNSQAALAMGIDIRDAALAHSDLLKASKLTVEQLDDESKTRVRLSEIFRQTIPIVGAAAAATQQIAGANEILNKKLEMVKVTLGSQGAITLLYTRTLQKLADTFLSLPPPILEAAGATQDFLGVMLKVTGTIVKYVFLVGGLAAGYKILAGVVATNTTLQALLTRGFASSAKAIGVQTVAVTSLSTAWANLLVILRAGLVQSLRVLVTMLGTVAISIGKILLTLAPLLLKFAAFALVIYSLGKSLRDFWNETGLGETVMMALGGAVEFVTTTFKKWFGAIDIDGIGILARLLVLVKDLTDLLVTGLAGAFLTVALGIETAMSKVLGLIDDAITKIDNFQKSIAEKLAGLKNFFAIGDLLGITPDDLKDFSKGLSGSLQGAATAAGDMGRVAEAAANKTGERLEAMGERAQRSIGSIMSLGEGAAYAATRADLLAAKTNMFGDKALKAKEKAGDLQKGLDLLGKVAERVAQSMQKSIEVNASEFDMIRIRGAAEIESLQRLIEEVKLSKELTKAQKARAVADINLAQNQEAIAIHLELQKKAAEGLKDIVEDTFKLAQEFSLLGLDEVEQYQFKVAEQTRLLRFKQDQLTLERELNAEAIAAIDAQIAMIEVMSQERVFQIQLSESSTFGQALAEQFRRGASDLNVIIGLFNDRFGTNIGKMSQETINAIALGAGKFVSSLRGAFGVTSKLLGDGMTRAINLGITGFNKMFGTAFEALPDILGPVFESIGEGMGSFLDGMIDVVGKMFDPDFIQGIADAITRLIDEFPQLLMKAFNSLHTAMMKLIDKLPQIVSQLMDNMNVIVQKIMDAMPEIINKLSDALEIFLDRLPEIIGRILDKLPDILNTLLSRLPEIITKLFSAVGTIIAQIIKVIPELLKTLFDHLPNIIEAIITGLLDAMGMIAAAFIDWFVSGGAERMVGAFIRMVPRLVVAIVRGIINGLAKGLGHIFKGFKVPDSFSDIPKKFNEGFKKLGAKATQEASQLFKVMDMKMEARGQNLADRIQDSIDQATTRLGDRFHGLIDALLAAWRWIYDNLIKPFLDALTTAWRWIWDNILKPLLDGITKVWRWVWDNIIKPLLDGLTAVWRWIWDNILKPVIDGLKAIWVWVYDNILKPAWDALKAIWDAVILALNTLWLALKTIWDAVILALTTIWNAVKTIFDTFVAAIQAVWDWFKTNILDKFAAGIQAVWDWFKLNILDKFASGVQAVWDWFKTNILDKFASGVQTVWNWFKTNILDKFASGVTTAFEWVKEKVVDPLTKMGSKIADGFKDAFTADYWKELGGKIWTGLKDAVKNGIDKVKGWGTSIVDGFWERISAIWSNIAGIGTQIVNGLWERISAIWESFASIGGQIVNGLWNGIVGLWNSFIELGGNIAAGLWNTLITFDWGALFGGGGGGGGGIFGSTGGAVTGSGISYFQSGGFAQGTDTVPAMLTPGEFIMSRGAVEALGLGTMHQLNRGVMPAGGGDVTNNFDIRMEIKADGSADETFVRTKLMPQFKEELKKATLRGELIVSKRGVF